MNNETNRLSQLIATAADRELGTRPDGQPRRQDKAAAEAIEAEYLFIRRSELPAVDIVFKDNGWHVDVGSEAGTWSCKSASPDYARKTGLEYLAASIALQEHRDIEANLEAVREAQRLLVRRDTLASQFRGEGIPYADVSPPLKLAIDHIIEIEKAA